MEEKITKEDILKRVAKEGETKGFLTRSRIFWVIVLIMLGVVYYYFGISQKKNLQSYTTAPITKRDLTVKVSATGNIEPTNSVDVGIEVSGTIADVLVDYNDKVIRGQVLAKLDTTKLLSGVNNSKASLEVAQANLLEGEIGSRDAKRELERLKELSASTHGDYPTQKEIDQAEINYEKAEALKGAYRAKVHQAEATLKSDEDDLKKAIVVSPIDGIVLSRAIEAGQSVVAMMQIPILFTLARNLTTMRAIISVDEADIGKVKERQKVEFEVDAYPERNFEGVISQIRLNSQTVDGVVTYEAVVDVNNSNLLLKPGMTVSAEIITTKLKGRYVVPNAALRFTPTLDEKGGKNIFNHRANNQQEEKNKQKHIWILQSGEPQQIIIETGLSDGVYTELKSKDLDLEAEVITATIEKSDGK